MSEPAAVKAKSSSNVAKFIVLNVIGIFVFFVSVTINGTKSIPIDHIVTVIRSIPNFVPVYGGLIVAIGAVVPFVRGTWNKDRVTTVFSLILAAPVVMFLYEARWNMFLHSFW